MATFLVVELHHLDDECNALIPLLDSTLSANNSLPTCTLCFRKPTGTRNHYESSVRGHEKLAFRRKNSATESESEENVNVDGLDALALSPDDYDMEMVSRLILSYVYCTLHFNYLISGVALCGFFDRRSMIADVALAASGVHWTASRRTRGSIAVCRSRRSSHISACSRGGWPERRAGAALAAGGDAWWTGTGIVPRALAVPIRRVPLERERRAHTHRTPQEAVVCS